MTTIRRNSKAHSTILSGAHSMRYNDAGSYGPIVHAGVTESRLRHAIEQLGGKMVREYDGTFRILASGRALIKFESAAA